MTDKLTSITGFGEGNPKGEKSDGFDGKKRWGNSAIKGHGVNSPAMMVARKGFEDAKNKAIHAKTDGGKAKELRNREGRHYADRAYENRNS